MSTAPYSQSHRLCSRHRLFVNIVCPPSYPAQTGFPVKVYIHGGYVTVSGSAVHVMLCAIGGVEYNVTTGSYNSAPRTG